MVCMINGDQRPKEDPGATRLKLNVVADWIAEILWICRDSCARAWPLRISGTRASPTNS